jgi:hypothetical protein
MFMDISYPPNKLGNFLKCFTLVEEKRGWGFPRKGQRRKLQCNPRGWQDYVLGEMGWSNIGWGPRFISSLS